MAAGCDSTVWWEMVPDSSSDTGAVGSLHRHWCPQPCGTGRPQTHPHQQKVEQVTGGHVVSTDSSRVKQIALNVN